MRTRRFLVTAGAVLLASAPARAQCGAWSPVGSGSRRVEVVASYDDGTGPALYAGGWFANPGGGLPDHLARWDGATWTPFPNAVSHSWATPLYSPGTVRSLAVFDDGSGPALYAGGLFDTVQGAPANNVARWDGANWSPVGAGSTQPSGVLALEVFDDGSGPALYAGGMRTNTTAGGAAASYVDRWDGAQWTPVGAFFVYYIPSGVTSFAVFDDGTGPALYAGGTFSLYKWDGTGTLWETVVGPAGPHLLTGRSPTSLPIVSALEVHDDGTGPALYVAGQFTRIDTINGPSVPAENVARFDGTAWSALGGGLSGPFSLQPRSPHVDELLSFDDGSGPALYAAGRYSTAGGAPAANVAVWSAATWSELGGGVTAPPGGTAPFAAALGEYDDGSGAALHVGGEFASAGSVAAESLAKWQVVPAAGSYCTAGVSSLGCVSALTATGFASASSAAGFQVDVSGVEGRRNGVIVFGTNGPGATPWGGGSSFQCVSPPLRRTGIQDSGGTPGACDGSFALDFNTWMAANPAAAPGVGQAVWMQAWFRDPGAVPSTSLSDALTFAVCP